MYILYPALLVAGLIVAGSALAGEGEALAKNSNCTSCHAVDKKLVGPSFKDVAAKYSNNKSAQATLEKKVRSGGGGVWGKIPMPPNPKLSDDDIKTIVQWVLTLK